MGNRMKTGNGNVNVNQRDPKILKNNCELTVIRSDRIVRFEVAVADNAYSLIPSASFSSSSPTLFKRKGKV
jgi:hypothetical protein